MCGTTERKSYTLKSTSIFASCSLRLFSFSCQFYLPRGTKFISASLASAGLLVHGRDHVALCPDAFDLDCTFVHEEHVPLDLFSPAPAARARHSRHDHTQVVRKLGQPWRGDGASVGITHDTLLHGLRLRGQHHVGGARPGNAVHHRGRLEEHQVPLPEIPARDQPAGDVEDEARDQVAEVRLQIQSSRATRNSLLQQKKLNLS